jgi:hypothetical protein
VRLLARRPGSAGQRFRTFDPAHSAGTARGKGNEGQAREAGISVSNEGAVVGVSLYLSW